MVFKFKACGIDVPNIVDGCIAALGDTFECIFMSFFLFRFFFFGSPFVFDKLTARQHRNGYPFSFMICLLIFHSFVSRRVGAGED